jgi:hypothetical protein
MLMSAFLSASAGLLPARRPETASRSIGVPQRYANAFAVQMLADRITVTRGLSIVVVSIDVEHRTNATDSRP